MADKEEEREESEVPKKLGYVAGKRSKDSGKRKVEAREQERSAQKRGGE